MPTSYRTRKARKKNRDKKARLKIFKRTGVKCGEPCKNSKWLFEQTSKGCKRTCTKCGQSITESTDMNTSISMVKYQGVLQEEKRSLKKKIYTREPKRKPNDDYSAI